MSDETTDTRLRSELAGPVLPSWDSGCARCAAYSIQLAAAEARSATLADRLATAEKVVEAVRAFWVHKDLWLNGRPWSDDELSSWGHEDERLEAVMRAALDAAQPAPETTE